MNLVAVEGIFQNYLRSNHPGMIALINENDQLNATDRLAIYSNAYRLRLLEILENDYPKLQILLGQALREETFEHLAQQYIDSNPSQHFSIRYFGQHLASFLAATPPYCNHPYLAEMAQFEWAMGDSLDAADDDILTPNILTSLPLERFAELKLAFHPSVQLLTFAWDTPQLWQAIEHNKPERSPQLLTSPTFWIVFRSHLECVFRSLTENEKIALETLQNHKTMAYVCEQLCEKMEEEKIPLFILQCLDQWLAQGIISKIS